jgi:hypothetical protein
MTITVPGRGTGVGVMLGIVVGVDRGLVGVTSGTQSYDRIPSTQVPLVRPSGSRQNCPPQTSHPGAAVYPVTHSQPLSPRPQLPDSPSGRVHGLPSQVSQVEVAPSVLKAKINTTQAAIAKNRIIR